MDGDVLPPHVQLLRDFVNTYEPQVDEETLTSPDRLRDWLAGRGLLGADETLSPSDVALARAFREGLRSALLPHAGHRPEPAAMAALDNVLTQVPVRMTVSGDAAFTLVPVSAAAIDLALVRLLDAIRQATEDRSWARLKVCARDTCRWAYFDASRNQVRRWCSMAGCGNHIKMKRAYATRKDRARTTHPAEAAATIDDR